MFIRSNLSSCFPFRLSLTLAHRLFWALIMFRRPSADIFRLPFRTFFAFAEGPDLAGVEPLFPARACKAAMAWSSLSISACMAARSRLIFCSVSL
jgi:hypothetical protein